MKAPPDAFPARFTLIGIGLIVALVITVAARIHAFMVRNATDFSAGRNLYDLVQGIRVAQRDRTWSTITALPSGYAFLGFDGYERSLRLQRRAGVSGPESVNIARPASCPTERACVCVAAIEDISGPDVVDCEALDASKIAFREDKSPLPEGLAAAMPYSGHKREGGKNLREVFLTGVGRRPVVIHVTADGPVVLLDPR